MEVNLRPPRSVLTLESCTVVKWGTFGSALQRRPFYLQVAEARLVPAVQLFCSGRWLSPETNAKQDEGWSRMKHPWEWVSRQFQTNLGSLDAHQVCSNSCNSQAAAVRVKVGLLPFIHVVSCCFKLVMIAPGVWLKTCWSRWCYSVVGLGVGSIPIKGIVQKFKFKSVI